MGIQDTSVLLRYIASFRDEEVGVSGCGICNREGFG